MANLVLSDIAKKSIRMFEQRIDRPSADDQSLPQKVRDRLQRIPTRGLSVFSAAPHDHGVNEGNNGLAIYADGKMYITDRGLDRAMRRYMALSNAFNDMLADPNPDTQSPGWYMACGTAQYWQYDAARKAKQALEPVRSPAWHARKSHVHGLLVDYSNF